MTEKSTSKSAVGTATNLALFVSRGTDGFLREGKLSGFLRIVLQCALLLLLIDRFALENEMFRQVVRFAFGGFLIHYFLPARFRLPFFLAVSLGTIAYCLGLHQAKWHWASSIQRTGALLGIGLGLIGICHLPVRFAGRVALLVATGAGLAVFRAGSFRITALEAIWPILGAMFMFRLMIYNYDRDHDKEPVRWPRVLAYFFTFPNIWLFVSPVIDFKTFCRTYYNEEPLKIYEKGVIWMMRGLVQLILWRLVYHQLYLDPNRVANGSDLVQFLVSNVALYLRVSGQFHFVIGLLHLFGFNLPETNQRYFLASSFTDYWRRVNIYWKDFIMKVFFYPAVFRLKAWGTTWSIVAATLFAFVATWLLHSYQWFWLRGNFPIMPKDLVFWGALGVLVSVNAYREAKHGRKRSLGKRAQTWRDLARLALNTGGTFAVITVLWSIWSCDTLGQWTALWQAADARALIFGGATVAVIMVAAVVREGAILKWPARRDGKQREAATVLDLWRRAALTCVLPAMLLCGLKSSRVSSRFGQEIHEAIQTLARSEPNKSDEEFMVRGYYENLMDVGRFNTLLDEAFVKRPVSWRNLQDTDVVRKTVDYCLFELLPSKDAIINGRVFKTNRMGLRDQEYDEQKAPGTYRIALLGASIEMGWGVDNQSIYEQLLEARLNRESGNARWTRYEILNFSANNYSMLAQIDVLKKKALACQPDAVFLVGHSQDYKLMRMAFPQCLRAGVQPEDDFLKEIVAKAKLTPASPIPWADRQLMPYAGDMIRWACQQIVEECRRHKILPVYVYLPSILRERSHNSDAQLMQFARDAGFVVIPLLDVYGKGDRGALWVAPWDHHPNATGHQLIADALYQAMLKTGVATLDVAAQINPEK